MASSWGNSWGTSWADAWGTTGGGGGGVTVTFFRGLSKAHTSGLSINAVTLVDAGGGTYTVTETNTLSGNKTDEVSYEGYEY